MSFEKQSCFVARCDSCRKYALYEDETRHFFNEKEAIDEIKLDGWFHGWDAVANLSNGATYCSSCFDDELEKHKEANCTGLDDCEMCSELNAS